MADPHDSPENETPIQRRQRLLNLNAEGWKPEKEALETEEPAPVEEAATEPSRPMSRSERG